MAKQNKQTNATTTIKSIPTIYQGLNATATRANVCIMEDTNGNFSLHNSRAAIEKLQSFNALIKDSIHKIWENFDAFLKENKNTILTYHANLFQAEPDKEQDIVITANYVWNKIVLMAKSDLTTEIPVIAGRKSTIGICQYSPGSQKEHQLKTPQAQECFKLFNEAFTKYSAGRTFITEAELRQYIEDNAGRLHTKQEPWRIFQYYRPQLIQGHLITRK